MRVAGGAVSSQLGAGVLSMMPGVTLVECWHRAALPVVKCLYLIHD